MASTNKTSTESTRSFDFDGMVKYITDSVMAWEGDSVANMVSNEFDIDITYTEDSIWLIDDEEVDSEELSSMIRDALVSFDRKGIIQLYQVNLEGKISKDPLGDGFLMEQPS